VAVIGTGASAIQVIPALAPDVDHLVICQRTPAWVLPRNDHAISVRQRQMYGQIPIWQAFRRAAVSWANEAQLLSFTKQGVFRALGERIAKRHLKTQVPDPDLRDRLTPGYAMGCKRILVSDDYYPALMRNNVTVAPGLRSITPSGVVTEDGVEHPVDAIIWATGFAVLEPPLADRVTGRDGRLLADVLKSTDYAAYRGTAIHGFPNLFILQGPNTGLGHSSVVLMSEAQIDHIIHSLASGQVLEVTEDAQRECVESIDQRLSTTVWQQGGCRSWYQNGNGRNVALWPGSTHAFARMMSQFDSSAYCISNRQDAHATR
jgi:cation diffusion facilitator CzcD-associated flavoprotein CzcO